MAMMAGAVVIACAPWQHHRQMPREPLPGSREGSTRRCSGGDMVLTIIENFRAVFYTPFYAAFALNAYEAEGLEVQRVMSTSPAETAQALRRGQGDVAWGGPIRLLLANNQQPDSDLVIFCEVVRRDPFFLVGREPRPTWQLTDLLHGRVATVSEVPTPWLCLQHDLRLAGLDPAQVRRLPDRSMPENLA